MPVKSTVCLPVVRIRPSRSSFQFVMSQQRRESLTSRHNGRRKSLLPWLAASILAVLVATSCSRGAERSEHGYRIIRIAGPAIFARRDPASGAIAWQAMTCSNPSCTGQGPRPGEPFLFAIVVPDVSVGRDGDIQMPSSAEHEVPRSSCPVCGSDQWVVPYESPHVQVRRMELESELDASRDAIAANQAPSRTPAQIMNDLSKLSRTYLIPQ